MDRGNWWATGHRVAESDVTEHVHMQAIYDRFCASSRAYNILVTSH